MVSSSISWSSQHDLSRQHIRAAVMYARRCAEIEIAYIPGSLTEDSEEFDELHTEYTAHAVSSVVFAAAFLEAAIAKIQSDAADYMKSGDKSSTEYDIRRRMLQGTKRKEQKSSLREHKVLRKFDDALTAARNKKPNRSKFPYEAIDLLPSFYEVYLLINLRNAFIHYDPIWRPVISDNLLVEAVDENEIDALRENPITKKARFAFNQLLPVGPTRPFFPERCLGHGCAAWAVNATVQFAEEFYREINKEMSVPSPPLSLLFRRP